MESAGGLLQDLWNILGSQVQVFWHLIVWVFDVFTRWPLLIIWILWWLLAVNWKRMWPVLAMGAWLPFFLIMVLTAFVWSRIAPGPGNLFGFIPVKNFWWQLGDLLGLFVLALFCGYLQGRLGWAPAEIELEPPVTPAHDHGHH